MRRAHSSVCGVTVDISSALRPEAERSRARTVNAPWSIREYAGSYSASSAAPRKDDSSVDRLSQHAPHGAQRGHLLVVPGRKCERSDAMAPDGALSVSSPGASRASACTDVYSGDAMRSSSARRSDIPRSVE